MKRKSKVASRDALRSFGDEKAVAISLKQAFERGIRPGVILAPVLIFLTLIIAGITLPDTFIAT